MTKLEPIKALVGLICYINNMLTQSRARLSAFTIFAHELLIKLTFPASDCTPTHHCNSPARPLTLTGLFPGMYGGKKEGGQLNKNGIFERKVNTLH